MDTVYLLHFTQRYKHAGHYLGSAKNLTARLTAHEHGQGARLLQVVQTAGITWQLARTWDGGREQERQLKKQKNSARLCPLCKNSNRRPASAAKHRADLLTINTPQGTNRQRG